MIARPDALAQKVSLKSLEDVDAALHEMAWLTARQRSIELDAQAKIEQIKSDVQARLIVEIEGETCSIQERWQLLQAALFAWCDEQLKANLPPNKRSLKVSHGEIKLRAIPATVQVIDGKRPDDVARDLARRAKVVAAVEQLMHTEIDGIEVGKIIAVEYVLAKDQVREAWLNHPEMRETLQKLSIFVEEGKEQITIAPAAIRVATNE